MENKDGVRNYVYETKTIYTTLNNTGTWKASLQIGIDAQEVIVKRISYDEDAGDAAVITCDFLEKDDILVSFIDISDSSPSIRHILRPGSLGIIKNNGTATFKVQKMNAQSQLELDLGRTGHLFITLEFRQYRTKSDK